MPPRKKYKKTDDSKTNNKEDFKNIVVGDNPNMWYDEYHEYINNPTDEGKTAINNKLKTLVKEMCLMPEYHLS